jgi:hypothetical protein
VEDGVDHRRRDPSSSIAEEKMKGGERENQKRDGAMEG